MLLRRFHSTIYQLSNRRTMSSFAQVLNTEECQQWEAILARAPVGKQKGKPSQEEIERIRAYRTDRKAFLDGLSKEKREAINGKPKGPSKKEIEQKRNEAAAAQLKELKKLAIEDIELVDIGANLQSRNSKPAIEKMLVRAFASGTKRVVLTGCSIKGSSQGITTSEWWYRNTALNEKVKVYTTVGVHPHDAKTICDATGNVILEKLDTLRTLASSPFCVSLGECGLDYDRMFSKREVQVAAFDAQVQLACELQRPLFVHLRERDLDKGAPIGAYDDFVQILNKYPDLKPEMVCVHCFTGDAKNLDWLIQSGFYVGLTGFVGMKKRATANGTLDALARENAIPLDRLMIETDSPFMTPDKCWIPKGIGIKGKNEPCVLPAVCNAVAAAMHLEPLVVAKATTENANLFFDFPRADNRISEWLNEQAINSAE